MEPRDERHEPRAARLTTVMGVARALLTTTPAPTAVKVLIEEFGWDRTFQALAVLRDEHAAAAFGVAWQHLLAPSADLRDDAGE